MNSDNRILFIYYVHMSIKQIKALEVSIIIHISKWWNRRWWVM